jgi:hypothetical protein
MPWEETKTKYIPSNSDRTGQLIFQAQKAEFEKNDLNLALSLLNRALSFEASSLQKCLIQVQKGRIFSKLGDEKEAHRIYRAILGQPGGLTYEYGIPFSLYAADRLLVLSSDVVPVIDRLEILMGEIRWLSSGALYFIRDIIGQIRMKSINSNLSVRNEKLGRAAEIAL